MIAEGKYLTSKVSLVWEDLEHLLPVSLVSCEYFPLYLLTHL